MDIEIMSHLRVACLIGLAVLAQIFLGAADDGSIKSIPVMTGCQALRDPDRYAGQAVIIVGSTRQRLNPELVANR